MFKKRHLNRREFGNSSGLKKWLFVAFVFIIIALIWVGYFVFIQYIGKKDAVVSGVILYKEDPVIDATIRLGNEEAVTDENGEFVLFNIAYGKQSINISKSGYIDLGKSFFVWRKKNNLGRIEIVKDSDKIIDFSGRVLDSFSKKPIKDAVINLEGAISTTDLNGKFVFKDLEKKGYNLEISAIGYRDFEKSIEFGEITESSEEFFLSPYGKISFASSRDGKTNIYSVGYDGFNLKNYTADIKGNCWNGRFSFDGKKLVFYSDVGEELDQWGQKVTNLYFINIDGKEERKINHDNVIPEDDYRLSQASDRVVFLGKDKDTDKKELYLASIGKLPEWIQLTDNDVVESNFDISADGNMVVFGAYEEGERKIFLIDVNKREIKPVLSSQNREGNLAFSPDNKTFLYTIESYDFETKVFIYDIATGESKQIYKNVAGIKDIVWNVDGSKIAFIASRDDRNYIYTINSDGKNEARIIEESGSYEKLVWPPLEKILIVKIQDGNAKSLAVIDLTQRKLQKIETISNDTIGWQKD